MNKADEFKIIDSHGIAVPLQDPAAIFAAAVRAIMCLQEIRRAQRNDCPVSAKLAGIEADHIIKSAGFSL